MTAEASEEKPLPSKEFGSSDGNSDDSSRKEAKGAKPRTPSTATTGAYEAEEALFDQCGEPYAQRDHVAMDEATAYLVNEAETRPTLELLGLLGDAANDLLGGFCEGNPENLRRSGQLLRAAEKVEDAVRGPNRFLDK